MVPTMNLVTHAPPAMLKLVTFPGPLDPDFAWFPWLRPKGFRRPCHNLWKWSHPAVVIKLMYSLAIINHPPNHHEIYMGGINHQKWIVYHCYTHIIPFGNQTWLAGKSTINGGFYRKITDFCGPFSSTPCLMTPQGIPIELPNTLLYPHW